MRPNRERDISAANEDSTQPEELSIGVLVANQYSTKAKDNWVLLSPYGEFPNVVGLQVFNKTDAEAICNEFNSAPSIGVRAIGLPWYVGHPDHPQFKEQYKDTAAKGRIKELEARDDGLWANVKWNDEGKNLITSEAFHGHSVNWRMRRNGDNEYHPFSLKSVGFTNEPGIPVPAITTANERTNMSKPDNQTGVAKKPTLMDYIKKLTGKDVANDDDAMGAMDGYAANSKKELADLTAKHSDLTAKHGVLQTMCNSVLAKYGANEKGELPEATLTTLKGVEFAVPEKDLVVTMANEISTVRKGLASALAVVKEAGVEVPKDADLVVLIANEVKTARAGRTAAELLVANERKASADLMLGTMIAGGFLTKAEADALRKEDGKDVDFANEASNKALVGKLSGLKPKIAVVSTVGNLGHVSSQIQKKAATTAARTDLIIQAANEYMEAEVAKGHKCDQMKAHAHIAKTRPDLFTGDDKNITR
jgi:hypothetical protein